MPQASSVFSKIAPLVFVLLWATGFVLARLTVGHVEPISFLAYRFPFAALLLLLLSPFLKLTWLKPREALHAMVAGVLLHALYLAPIYWAVAHGLPGGVSALIVGLQPLITAFLAALVLKEIVTMRHWLALLVGITGVTLVLWPKFSFAMLGGITPLTAGLGLLGCLGVSCGTIYQKRFAGNLPLVASVLWQYAGASLVVVALAALLEDFKFDQSPQAWLAIFWSIFVISLGAVFMLMMLIRDGSVAKVSTLIFLVPGVAAVMTYLLFDEQLEFIQVLGMALSAAAVLIVNRMWAQQPRP